MFKIVLQSCWVMVCETVPCVFIDIFFSSIEITETIIGTFLSTIPLEYISSNIFLYYSPKHININIYTLTGVIKSI